MAHLRVRLRGKTVQDIQLSEERSYVAGRKEDCDIVLQPEKGISREHFKVSFVNGAWTIEVISRYGEVHANGEEIRELALEHGTQFHVPPYEFDFLTSSPQESHSEDSTSANLPALTGVNQINAFDGSEERTVIGVAPTAAYIKIVDRDGEVKEMIRLDDGESWVAGRDASGHIHIKDQRVSRRQFEIRRLGSQYHIIDLGSVNGTLVNGSPISANESTPIRSGDVISVLSNYLYFELHDSQFQRRVELVNIQPSNHLMPLGNTMPAPYAHAGHDMTPYQPGPSVQHHNPPPVEVKKFDFQKHRLKLVIGAVAVLALAFVFSGNEKKTVAQPGPMVAPGSPAELFMKLKPEQQALVRQRYKDAKNLYMQGKYQLAQDEIVKIQELVPDYEDIKEIERLSKEATFIQEQQRRQEQIEIAKVETEEKIQKQTAICQKKINPMITSSQMEDCLSPVLQFNPEHPKILDLKQQVEMLTAQRDAKSAERAVYQNQVSQLKSLFARAQQVHKKGRPLDAVAAYERVVESRLPDPSGVKTESKRTIASIRQMMNSKTASLQAEAEKFAQSQNLKGAIVSLRKARVIDPNNPELPEKIDRYMTELRKQMMSLYQEGILEESFGNVEGGDSKAGAKEKWRKILDLDVPDGEYYKKAFIKLKKYGAL